MATPTQDPKKATLFFIPARCTAYRKSASGLAEGTEVAASTMAAMLGELKLARPHWNASLGADHFYICSHDMGAEVTRSADAHLAKNAIALVNTADYSEPSFIAHKDISVPLHPGREAVDWAKVGQGGRPFDPTLRTRLAFLAGNPGRYTPRDTLLQLCVDAGKFCHLPLLTEVQ